MFVLLSLFVEVFPQLCVVDQTGSRQWSLVDNLWASLAPINFISKVVFLKSSFINDFLDKAELFWKKCLIK